MLKVITILYIRAKAMGVFKKAPDNFHSKFDGASLFFSCNKNTYGHKGTNILNQNFKIRNLQRKTFG